nr:hypothetical protein [Tanacetum cinerariifolium]
DKICAYDCYVNITCCMIVWIERVRLSQYLCDCLDRRGTSTQYLCSYWSRRVGLPYRSNPLYAIKECSSCGTLYTRDCSCSKRNVKDKILVPKPPKNCARCTRCGYLVDGPKFQGCALLRQELEENLVIHSPDFQNTSEPSNASTNVVNAPQEPYKQEEKRIEEQQAAKAQNWKLPVCYDDDDDEESLNSLGDNIISELPSYSAVTPNEPIDSLSMGDEHSNTIPATGSDEFIKSCVENLVPNPSESEGENECDVPAGFTTSSNVPFDADYDFDSGDDQSTSDEDFPKNIYSNPFFDKEINPMNIDQHSFNVESDLIGSMPNHDFSITISSKNDSLFDEFAGELTLLTSIPPRIDETDCHPEEEIRLTKRLLYENSSPRPLEEIVFDNSNADIESFSPSPIPNEDSDSHMEEIDLPFTPDDPMPSGIEDDDYDFGMDISILEELLDNFSLSLPANESYHFDIPSPYRPPAKPPDGNTRTLNIKMLGDVSDQKVPIPNLTITRVLNQEKSPDLLSHQGFEAFQPSAECPMIINA